MRAPETVVTPFIWKDFSRFVEVGPVASGWLVMWGRYHDRGRVRELSANRIYRDLHGARRRVADAVFELTRDPSLVAEALTRFDRTPFPRHASIPPSDPL